MTQSVGFINRETELELIDKLVKESNTQKVLCIHAQGGIGKTRLLQEVRQRYLTIDENAPLLVTDIIDFDNRAFHIPQNLGRYIAQMLGEDNFEPYFHALHDWRQKEMIGFSPDRLTDEALAIDQFFIECFNRVSAKRRVILLLDTIESLENSEAWNYVARIGSKLRNAVVLVAGRSAKKFAKALQIEIGSGNVLIHSLEPLDDAASEKYLRAKQALLHVPLEPELAEKLLFLARGRPILIDLSIELLKHETPLDWLLDNSLDKIKSLSRESSEDLQRKFERQLTQHIAYTRKKIDWLILAISRIYPINLKMLAELFEKPEEEYKLLFEEAKNRVFVKQLSEGRITLHDEMRRLVNEYIWPKVDPDGDRKRHDSEWAAGYYEREIQVLTKHIRKLENEEKTAREEANIEEQLSKFLEREALERQLWLLKGQQLEHLLFLNIDTGVKAFAEMFDEASRTHRFVRETLLVPMYQYTKYFSPDQMYEFNSRRVKYWLDEGQRQQAIQLVTEILTKENLLPEQRVDMLIQRGNLEIRLGHLNRGWSDFDTAVQISHDHKPGIWLVRALNGRGWAYRVRGNFTLALEDYIAAYALSLKLDARKQTGWLLNNIAYVNAFKGNGVAAFNSCEAALEIWDEINFPLGKGATYTVMGEISRWLDRLSQSMTYYTKALDIFTAENNIEWISRARCGRASVFRTREELDKGQEDLNYAFENGPLNIRPQIFYERAKIAWLEQDLQQARQWFEKCREESKAIGETFYDYMSFADLLELAWEFGEYARWNEFADEYEKLYSNREDEESLRLGGSCLRKIADLALCAGEYDRAINLYKQGLPFIAKYEVHERHTINEVIPQIDKRLHKCQRRKIFNRLGKDLTELWVNNPEELAMRYPKALSVFNRWISEGQSNE